jgi:2-phospho-L-lactate guanylyltransferase
MTTWALIPVKAFERAKSRLSEALPEAERVQLARQLFTHVLEAAQTATLVERVAVVSDSARVRVEASTAGALSLEDDTQRAGLAHVVDSALRELGARGAARTLICMADLPQVTSNEIDAVLQRLDETQVVLVPDVSGMGTNAIAIASPSVLPSCLGHPDSLARHRARAHALGLSCQTLNSPGIAFDVDTVEDLERLSRA